MYTKDFAKKYYEEELVEKKYVLLPAIKKILAREKWNTLVDLGCGSGYYCRPFAAKNHQVVGIDKNENQLDLAREAEKKHNLGITYIKADLTNLKVIDSNSFDAALMNFVIVEIAKSSAIKKILKEANRILKNNGLLIIGQVHPHNLNRKSSVVEKNLTNKKDSYFTNGALALSRARSVDGSYLTFNGDYHYTLDFILTSLSEAGFVLESFNELSHKENNPTHMLIVARKVSQ